MGKSHDVHKLCSLGADSEQLTPGTDLATITDADHIAVQCAADLAHRARLAGPLRAGWGGQALTAPQPGFASWQAICHVG